MDKACQSVWPCTACLLDMHNYRDESLLSLAAKYLCLLAAYFLWQSTISVCWQLTFPCSQLSLTDCSSLPLAANYCLLAAQFLWQPTLFDCWQLTKIIIFSDCWCWEPTFTDSRQAAAHFLRLCRPTLSDYWQPTFSYSWQPTFSYGWQPTFSDFWQPTLSNYW